VNKRRGAGRSVNRAELAAIFGVTTQTVDAWVRKGLACTKDGGKVAFNTADVIEWREGQAVDRVSSGITPSANIEEARLRKINGEAVLVEMEIAEKRAELVPIEDTVSVVGEAFVAARAKWLAVPSKYGPIMAPAMTEAESRALLDRAVREVLDELVADALSRAEAGDVSSDGGGAETATDADGVGVGGQLSQAFF